MLVNNTTKHRENQQTVGLCLTNFHTERRYRLDLLTDGHGIHSLAVILVGYFGPITMPSEPRQAIHKMKETFIP